VLTGCAAAVETGFAGNSARNDVWLPDVIGTADGTADKIEATQHSTTTREVWCLSCNALVTVYLLQETLVAIPIISLESPQNRKRCECLAHTLVA